MDKIKKLENRLEEITAKEYNVEKSRQYHRRIMGEAKEPEERAKHEIKADYFIRILNQIRLEKQSLQGQIATEKLGILEAEHKKKLKDLNLECSELLQSLKDALEKGKHEDALELLEDLMIVYARLKVDFKEEELKPFNYLNFQSCKIRLSHILEEKAEEAKISAIRGPSVGAQKRENISQWTTQLVGQITSAMEMLKS